jgi:hypothetical protein
MLHAYKFGVTEHVPKAGPEYVEVAEEYEEDVLVISVLQVFTKFSMSNSYPRQSPDA